jgi:oligopeptide/dipeptide ABC transporter ATP-binding protein
MNLQAAKNLLEVKNLKKYFPIKAGIWKVKGYIRAVDGISFFVREGETLGLVGESGCGKTTVGRCILRLIEPTTGEIYFDGQNIMKLNEKDMRKYRRYMQIVFQDPFASLNPRKKIIDLVAEPLVVHGFSKNKLQEKVIELLDSVGLGKELFFRFPHELSGGQRQRVCIARALALNPKFIVLDEPTSSLDVSVQAQILNLLKELRWKLSLSYLFISHNLSVVKFISNRIAVMYLGKIVESADSKELFTRPLHPYTQALLSSIPVPEPNFIKKRVILQGEIPTATAPPSGCRFHPRCQYAQPICGKKEPNLIEENKDHFVACHLI